MSKLISGKEALIALANGEDVEVKKNKEWNSCDIAKATAVEYFINDYYEFRLKPRTILINGIEVPVPLNESEQRKGAVYYLNDGFPDGYALMELDPLDSVFYIGAWRTEEEIKQVVAALRQVLKGEQA